jgi:NAD-dependent SIR2 family protein deacetylase
MWCGCFHCLQIFEAVDVVDWIDDGETPLCPRCGVDSVMLGVTDLMELLTMKRIRFPRRVEKHGVDPRGGSASDDANGN